MGIVVSQVEPLSESDERLWAMLAHLSVLVNLFTGFLGAVIALVIYIMYKDRSKFVAYHSFQALIFQLILLGIGVLVGIAWGATWLLSMVLIGLICIPFTCILSLIPLAGIVYAVVGGIQANQGEDFRYYLVGDWEFVREKLG
ncbi:MAG: DUF4870 domain-containing protein [Chloroflexi bacterium]|nr:DUF4870 domain-containing protein [Chloroflexota bacterium]